MTIMGRRRQAIATVVAFTLTSPVYSTPLQVADSPNTVASTATSADPHKVLAHSLKPGTRVKVKLRDGRTLKAAFIAVRGDELLLMPKDGAEQAVSFDSITKLSRDRRTVARVAKTVGIAAVSIAATVVILSIIGCAQENHPNLLFCEDTSLRPRR